MKLISFVVPCYNSSSYMHHALDTILEIKEDIELIIVNDGSTDDTLKIAKEYQKKYPKVIKVIDKENGGHGSGVNAGLGIASGKYFKVVDSDDWVDTSSLKKVVATLKKQDIDMLIVNYVYEKEGSPKEMGYLNVFKENEIFTWQEVGHFKVSEYLLMHSVFYKTSLLKEIHFHKDLASVKDISIAVPDYLGCGLAGGDWEIVFSRILLPLFQNSEETLIIYYLPESANRLWKEFRKIPVNADTGCIERGWHGFAQETGVGYIYKWFDKTFPEYF